MSSHERPVIVGFFGGPLDGWCDERTTDETVLLPELFLCADDRMPGQYRVVLHCPGHFVYRWSEDVKDPGGAT